MFVFSTTGLMILSANSIISVISDVIIHFMCSRDWTTLGGHVFG